jgi:hemin uptake protein HemP
MSQEFFANRADCFGHSRESGNPEPRLNLSPVAGTSQIATATPAPTVKKPRIESNHLFQGKSEIIIVHQNEEYNLRITRSGKLILTK